MLLSVLNVALVLPVKAISHFIILALPTKIFDKEVGFLVQSFFETLQYCDEWRKFTSVSQ